MISRFKDYIEQHQLFTPSDSILLAVSGGIDSMVLWKLFEETGYQYAVIHCNFQLRGKESDRDEELVRERARETGTALFVKKMDTLEYAAITGTSIEMAARELRYKWFEEVRSEKQFRYIATAHHQDDLLETFFINLIRKTGIRGLTGFREKTGTLIRPLLFTNRKEIEIWAMENDVEFRKDASNDDIVFQRNFIRHQIIPQLETLNPAFRNNLSETLRNMRETEDFYRAEINRQIKKISDPQSDNPGIIVSQLCKLPFARQVLFEWMNGFGFNNMTINKVYSNLGGETGRQYFSKTHRLVTDRNKLIITLLPDVNEQVFYMDEQEEEIHEPIHLLLEWKDAAGFEIVRNPKFACLDAGKLVFPLIIRKWHPGAYFQPLGMSGFKKISDFFVDEKFSIPEKERSWVLYSEEKVVWIVGHRIDNRFKVTSDTCKILVIKIKD
jgi:tRNA(Ile)-lysidine synthase